MSAMLGSLLLILAFASGSAFAAEAAFEAATFQKLLASGQPLAVDFHAGWCLTCRAQEPLLRSITEKPEFHSLTLLIADFDAETALRRSLNVSKQSTVVVFHRGKEVARSTGDTTEAGLTQLLRSSIP
jgi:thioredoxin 1